MNTLTTTSVTWSDWSCTVRVSVRDERLIGMAVAQTQTLMLEVEQAASRFQADSEISRCNDRAGRVTPVSPLLVELVQTALDAAEDTRGAVDPTIGRHLVSLGYDADIDVVRGRSAQQTSGVAILADRRRTQLRAPNWRAVRVDHELGLVTVPAGLALDLGATAKAWTADRAATLLHHQVGGPVLVEIGGDVAVAGADDDPFAIRVAEREGQAGELVDLSTGGLTTSTAVVRRWHSDGVEQHHVIDPATGRPASGPWRTASVWAPSAVAANTASTAALVMGEQATGWLDAHAPVARLVAADGTVRRLAGWPAGEVAA